MTSRPPIATSQALNFYDNYRHTETTEQREGYYNQKKYEQQAGFPKQGRG
ncbi:MAG: hypothetical protein KDD45_04540 [Bdellovibrionales bacterium]|nr:hypothetical protein [Bdellovibrionales bacterium]